MKILMLGNSYTFFHDIPNRLAESLHAEVTALYEGEGSHSGEAGADLAVKTLCGTIFSHYSQFGGRNHG